MRRWDAPLAASGHLQMDQLGQVVGRRLPLARGLLGQRPPAVNFRLIAEQWDRIGQFCAAFPVGHATASAALQRLNRFQASEP